MDQKRLAFGLLVALVIGLVAARYVYVQLRNAKQTAFGVKITRAREVGKTAL